MNRGKKQQFCGKNSERLSILDYVNSSMEVSGGWEYNQLTHEAHNLTKQSIQQQFVTIKNKLAALELVIVQDYQRSVYQTVVNELEKKEEEVVNIVEEFYRSMLIMAKNKLKSQKVAPIKKESKNQKNFSPKKSERENKEKKIVLSENDTKKRHEYSSAKMRVLERAGRNKAKEEDLWIEPEAKQQNLQDKQKENEQKEEEKEDEYDDKKFTLKDILKSFSKRSKILREPEICFRLCGLGPINFCNSEYLYEQYEKLNFDNESEFKEMSIQIETQVSQALMRMLNSLMKEIAEYQNHYALKLQDSSFDQYLRVMKKQYEKLQDQLKFKHKFTNEEVKNIKELVLILRNCLKQKIKKAKQSQEKNYGKNHTDKDSMNYYHSSAGSKHQKGFQYLKKDYY